MTARKLRPLVNPMPRSPTADLQAAWNEPQSIAEVLTMIPVTAGGG
jgi:hypothetical protein